MNGTITSANCRMQMSVFLYRLRRVSCVNIYLRMKSAEYIIFHSFILLSRHNTDRHAGGKFSIISHADEIRYKFVVIQLPL